MDFERLLSYAYHNNDMIVNALAKTEEGYPMISGVRSSNTLYPALVFSYIGGGDLKFADEENFTQRVTMEIDLYGNNIPYEVKEEIHKVFNDIGFFMIHRDSVKNPYTNIVHNLWHVKATMNQELFDYHMGREERIFKSKYRNVKTLSDGIYYDEVNSDKYTIVNGEKLIK